MTVSAVYRGLLTLASCLLLADVAFACRSGLDRPPPKPLQLRVGTYFLDASTRARVDGRGGNFGTRLDLEDDLDIDERKNTFLAHLMWRFHECHMLEMSYFKLTRSGETRAESEIRFGDTVIPIGVNVSSSFTTEVTRLGYSYRIYPGARWEVAFSAGLHVTRLRARLNSLQFDNVGRPISDREIASVTAPLPVLGFSAARRFGEKWRVGLRSQFFFLEVDDIDGSISHAATYVGHDTFENVGFGIGYDWFDVDVKTTDRFWRGAVDVRFNGPLLFVKGTF